MRISDWSSDVCSSDLLQEMDVRQRNLLHPEDLHKIRTPTLIVWGTNNPFGGVAEATAMHENIAGSQLEIFNECGHWPQHEHADRFNVLSIAFLKRNRSEEHTSELQSLMRISYAVFCLKKKKN